MKWSSVLLFCGCLGASDPAVLSLRVAEESAPPGGVALFRVEVTEPEPIVTGGGFLEFDSSVFGPVAGVAVGGSYSDTFGVAIQDGSRLKVAIRSLSGSLGAYDDLPLFVVAVPVRADAAVGRVATVPFTPAEVFLHPNGTSRPVQVAPGEFVAAGPSIDLLTPRAGMVAAGERIRVSGRGFVRGARIQVNEAITETDYVSERELTITAKEAFRVDGRRIRLRNGDGSSDVHYSYRKGALVGSSAVAMFQRAEPMFADPGPAGDYYAFFSTGVGGPVTGLAFQNPGEAPAELVISAFSFGPSPMVSANVTLPPNGMAIRAIEEWLPGGRRVPFGLLRVRTGSPVQLMHLTVRTSDGAVTPALLPRGAF